MDELLDYIASLILFISWGWGINAGVCNFFHDASFTEEAYSKLIHCKITEAKVFVFFYTSLLWYPFSSACSHFADMLL